MFNKIIHSRKPTGLIPKALKCSNKTVNIGAMTHEKDAHAECGKNYGSVNSKHAHPPARHFSGICHLIDPGGGEFVRKHLQKTSGWVFVNSSRSG